MFRLFAELGRWNVIRVAPVYADWREKLGSKCWALLEGHVGKLG